MSLWKSDNGDGGTVTDPNAIHDNVAGEIAAIAPKSPILGVDHLIIESVADANAKRSITASVLKTFTDQNIEQVLTVGGNMGGQNMSLSSTSQINATGGTHTTQTPINLSLPDLTSAGGVHVNSSSTSATSRNLILSHQNSTSASQGATPLSLVQQSLNEKIAFFGGSHAVIEWVGSGSFSSGSAPAFGRGFIGVDSLGEPRWRTQLHLGFAFPIRNPGEYIFGNDNVNTGTNSRYLSPGSQAGGSNVFNSDDTGKQQRTLDTFFATGLQVNHAVPAGNGNPIVYTLHTRKIGGPAVPIITALNVSLNSTSKTGFTELTTPIELEPTEAFWIVITKVNNIGSTPNKVTAELTGYKKG